MSRIMTVCCCSSLILVAAVPAMPCGTGPLQQPRQGCADGDQCTPFLPYLCSYLSGVRACSASLLLAGSFNRHQTAANTLTVHITETSNLRVVMEATAGPDVRRNRSGAMTRDARLIVATWLLSLWFTFSCLSLHCTADQHDCSRSTTPRPCTTADRTMRLSEGRYSRFIARKKKFPVATGCTGYSTHCCSLSNLSAAQQHFMLYEIAQPAHQITHGHLLSQACCEDAGYFRSRNQRAPLSGWQTASLSHINLSARACSKALLRLVRHSLCMFAARACL